MSDEPVVGIDLGTSNTVVAAVRGERAHVIADPSGRRVHPSVVSFHPKGHVLVGEAAVRRRMIDPANTISSIKRIIGRSFRSTAVSEAVRRAPFKIIEGENEQPLVVARGREHTIPEISAFVLRHARALAESRFGVPVRRAVITVPANFTDAQREATKAAGRIAGLDVMRILNEPTAAALAFGYAQGRTARIVVYDFGGGTFDTTILQLDQQVFEVLSTAGDPFLGGDDVDERIVRHMVDLFLRQNRVDLGASSMALARLRQVAEQIKCQLSERSRAVVQVQEIAFGARGEPLHLSFNMSRDELNAMSREVVQRSFLICDEALQLAGLTATQLDDVVLVGGMTRMPLLREGVRGYFGREPRTDINPDEVVAIGAAIHAASLARGAEKEAPQAVLLDVTPRGLGIAVVGGYCDTIIERNAQIPVEQTRLFSTSQDNQAVVRIQVCQGESRHFDENQPLGELVLDGLPPAGRGELKIAVTFEIDTDGILNVRARDSQTGVERRARMRVLGLLSEEHLDQLTRDHAERPAPIGHAIDEA